MEHSLLHALQLAGLIVALGGPVFVLGLLSPACRRLGPEPARETLAGALSDGVARWVTTARADRGSGDVPRSLRAGGRDPGADAVRRRRAGARRPLRDGDHCRAAGAGARRLSGAGGGGDPAARPAPVGCHRRARRRRPGVHGPHQSRRGPACRASPGDRGAARAPRRRGSVDRRPRAPPRGARHHHRAHGPVVSRPARRDRPAHLTGGPDGRVSAARLGRLRSGAPSPHAGRTC